jgi:ATP-dependent DNA helicase DinG
MPRIPLADVFGPEGRLATTLGSYEHRPQQREMAEAVASAFDAESRVLVEAATGTGKTIAYLVPAILSGKRTIVSTATKTLQEQIFFKDLPLLRKALPIAFRGVILKGRQNYLCLWQYDAFRQDPLFRRKEDAHYWPAIEAFAESTETGDRGEIADLPDDYPTWSDLSISADACLGRDCAYYQDCFVVRARQRAAEADIIVVNHHLFFADLALRTRTEAELLPAYEAVVFDEAHHLEATASGYFGVQVSNFRYLDLLGDAKRFLVREKAMTPGLQRSIADARDAVAAFFSIVQRGVDEREGRIEAARVFDGPDADAIRNAFRTLDTRMMSLATELQTQGALGEVGRRIVDRVEALGIDASLLVERLSDELVYVIEVRGRGVFLVATPVDLGPIFRDLLYKTASTQVFTSATLTTDGHFAFYRQRMGLPASTAECTLEPVFDYMNQALLFVPNELPDPSDPMFVEKLAPTMRRLVQLCEGRAFLLFTSYRNMREAVRCVAPHLDQTVLVQGDRSRNALLEAFREDTHSVLFATSSFWEGVDVQGDALSLVIIDKLPFASPGDPVLKARLAHIEANGGNGFRDYQVPSAAIALKQGFGRLIRHRDDCGIIAILDGRLTRKSYGARFLRSLPRARRTQDIEVVERWWQARTERDTPAPPNAPKREDAIASQDPDGADEKE